MRSIIETIAVLAALITAGAIFGLLFLEALTRT